MGMAEVRFITPRGSRHSEPLVQLLEGRSAMIAAEDVVSSEEDADRLHSVVKTVEQRVMALSATSSLGALLAIRTVRDELSGEVSPFVEALLGIVERFIEQEV